MTISYDRVHKYYATNPDWVKQFSDIYCSSFNDPSTAYAEQNTYETTVHDVWIPHLHNGRIALAFDGDSIVGLACVQPIEFASNAEQDHAEIVFRHLEKAAGIHRVDYPVWYFSELAVLHEYRNSEEHIGTSLIRFLMDDLRCRKENGLYGLDDKLWTLTRTDAYESMSINAFKREGFQFLEEIIQHDEESMQVVEHGGASTDKIWGYQIVHPLSW